MTKKDFGDWYKNKKPWLQYKARYLISKTRLDFNEVEELISFTVEELLNRLPEIKSETIDSYCFFCMRNMLQNKMIHPKRNETCCDSFIENTNVVTVYNMEEDNKLEKLIGVISGRVESEEDLIVFKAMQDGVALTSLGLNSYQVNKSVKKLKGMLVKKERKKGIINNPNGAPLKYVGFSARDINMVLFKVYPDLESVAKDGFTPELVRRCLKKGGGNHKGLFWNLNK